MLAKDIIALHKEMAVACEKRAIIEMIEKLIDKHDDHQTALARHILAAIKSRK